MKKLLSIIITISLLIGMVSISALADDYVTDWTISAEVSGSYVKMVVTNSTTVSSAMDRFVANIRYNPELMTPADDGISDSDLESLCETLMEAFPDDRIDSVDMSDMGTIYTVKSEPGVYVAGLMLNSVKKLWANDNMIVTYFKLKDNIVGKQNISFQWIKKNTNSSSADSGVETNNATMVLNGATTEVNVNFVDSTPVAYQGATTTDADKITANYFAGRNITEAETVRPNGKETEFTVNTPYFVMCAKIPVMNSKVMKNAGVLYSDTNIAEENFNIGNKSITNVQAERINFRNFFGVLFYGPGIVANKTYYARTYVTYDDNTTLYSDVTEITVE